MSACSDEYRIQLLRSVEQIHDEDRRKASREECGQMSDEQLLTAICLGLGLPPTTQFSNEQLLMIAGPRGRLELSEL